MTLGPLTLVTVRTSSGICHKIGPLPGHHGREPGMACIYDDYPAGERSAELLAYARLFAAAPGLVAALEELADNLGAYGTARLSVKEVAILERAKSALAAANG